MKTRKFSAWKYVTIVAVILFAASCANSQKKKEKAAEAEMQMSGQPMDSVTIIQSETIIVIDSLAPDSSALQQTPPKKTK